MIPRNTKAQPKINLQKRFSLAFMDGKKVKVRDPTMIHVEMKGVDEGGQIFLDSYKGL